VRYSFLVCALWDLTGFMLSYSVQESCVWCCIMRSYWIRAVLVCARELPVVDWWFTNHNFLFFNQFDYLARWAIIICNNSIHIFFNLEWLVCWLCALFLFSHILPKNLLSAWISPMLLLKRRCIPLFRSHFLITWGSPIHPLSHFDVRSHFS
jgi:hypothetical protein